MKPAFYNDHNRFLISVDCIIFGYHEDNLHLLLTKRKFEPAMGQWSLIGGFMREDESINRAAARVLEDLTGLDNVFLDQVGAFGEIDRDPGDRVVSVAFYALLNVTDEVNERCLNKDAQWFDIRQLPQLGFDHPQMIEAARVQLARKIASEPIIFNLLPQHFTLSRLQHIYEVISGADIDKRNFRKRIVETGCIIPTDLFEKTQRRNARLYEYRSDLYSKMFKFKLF